MPSALTLNQLDQQRLAAKHGEALQFAMQLITKVAHCSGADHLIDISQAHLVGSYYGGPADVQLIEKLVNLGAKVTIPTTLNASASDLYQQPSVIQNDIDKDKNCKLVKLYQAMGCQIELTCAPYHLPSHPKQNENIAWAESNAIVYANSVLAARTNKTFQYLDLCAALTGRIPYAGLYKTENRRASVIIQLHDIPKHWLQDDAFYQLLGLIIGKRCGNDIPVITGLGSEASQDNLRSLGAAAASSGNVVMFHAVGLTPEANSLDDALQHQAAKAIISINAQDISACRASMHSNIPQALSAVCLGTPHFSYTEFQQLLSLLMARKIHPTIEMYIATSRHVYKQLQASGEIELLLAAGIKLVTDTCTYYGLLLKNKPGTVMTCSAKWAYYAPGNLNITVLFASLRECIESAIAGQAVINHEFWAYD